MIFLPEEATDVNRFKDEVQRYLSPGEEFIFNAPDESSEEYRWIREREPSEKSAQQWQEELNRPDSKGSWKDVRLVKVAFNAKTGEPISGFLMLVGKRKT